MLSTADTTVFAIESQQVDQAAIDRRITFPCYKSFDEFIEVERLKSLHDYVEERVQKRLNQQTDNLFYTGPYRLHNGSPEHPGSRMIYLSHSVLPDSYFDLDKTELWRLTEAAEEFALLMDFIKTLPFKATGRMLIMYDDMPRPVTAHRDHTDIDVCHDFVWFRTNLKKPFYMLNHKTGAKQYVDSYTAWFDSVNQYHGADPCDGLSFSIRVDGIFTDEFKRQIPKPAYNAASTPALWACL
jgi:hypothetical protein